MRTFLSAAFLGLMILLHGTALAVPCAPTPPDELGPFYKPDAPVRSVVGKGYVLTGVVKSSADCTAIAGAKVELWMAGPDGEYADEYRATLFSDRSGSFRFESHLPPTYYGRPPHIHILVTAPGFRTLITQHYPERGKTTDVFNLILLPELKKK
jgi:protocatechuate 3,4-dioxygenase beta subunit